MPDWWEFTLVSLAALRTWRLLGADVLLDRPRDWLTRRDRFESNPGTYRRGLDEWLHCPWCLGFWVTLLWWAAWFVWPAAVGFAAIPFAASAVVALVVQTYDR